MKILVDTCVWSIALRRSKVSDQNPYVVELEKLIGEVRVQIIGPIRQELLSGIKSASHFDRLREYLSAFPDLALETDVYELAASYHNKSRAKGIQGSNVDFLICAVSTYHNLPILTFDKDFDNYQKYIPIELHPLR